MSVFDLYSIGVGPSSSHVIGPMRAAKFFLKNCKNLLQATRITIELRGSLAFTCYGHGTNIAIIAGLQGLDPKTVDPKAMHELNNVKKIDLLNQHQIDFDSKKDFILNLKDLSAYHSNAMLFRLYDCDKIIAKNELFSVGGGFVHTHDGDINSSSRKPDKYNFSSMSELVKIVKETKLSIANIVKVNELENITQNALNNQMAEIIDQMFTTIQSGLLATEILPGSLKIKRRAPVMANVLKSKSNINEINYTHSISLQWLNCFAIATNEENACGNRVVTSPTNGAAGVIPAVLYYYKLFYPNITQNKLEDFLFTAAAIGFLYKNNASISAAEVGCQGEIGVASSMAAGALTAVLGGNICQIENAAEIAMEHHLGLTCDPVAGLVQIPCIERNAMGAIKAVNASNIALMENGKNKVNLDQVIKTMYDTGKEMSSIFKETSIGGLAANVPNC